MIPRERISAGEWLAPWLRHQHLTRYAWAAQFCGGARVLDAACANAYGSAMLLQSGARSVIGLDVAAEAIVEAHRQHRGLPLLLGDGTRLPFLSGSFDVFISFETVEHVDRDDAFIAEARRVIKRGGAFVCSTPNRRLVNAGKTIRDHPFNPFHVREYSLNELAELLGRHFGSIEWFGQRRYERWYVDRLNALGRLGRSAAVRAHQIRKLLGLPFESAKKHIPERLSDDAETEVLIAVCR